MQESPQFPYFVKESIKEAKKLLHSFRESSGLKSDYVYEIYLPPTTDQPEPKWQDVDKEACRAEIANRQKPLSLIQHAEQILDKPIFIRKPGIPENRVSAYVLNKEACALIAIALSNNNCNTRMLICKELMHLFTFSVESATDTPEKASQLAHDILYYDLNLETEQLAIGRLKQCSSDAAAWYGALELLMPSDTVPKIRALKKELISSGTCPGKENYEIACLLKMPEHAVSFRLSESSDHIFEVEQPSTAGLTG